MEEGAIVEQSPNLFTLQTICAIFKQQWSAGVIVELFVLFLIAFIEGEITTYGQTVLKPLCQYCFKVYWVIQIVYLDMERWITAGNEYNVIPSDFYICKYSTICSMGLLSSHTCICSSV